jgi:hypothetical protein
MILNFLEIHSVTVLRLENSEYFCKGLLIEIIGCQ